MSGDFPVALILIFGAALVPLFRGVVRSAYMLLLPLLAFGYLLSVPLGLHGQIELLGQTLVLMRVDKLSLLFGYIFLLAVLLSVIYALHVDDTMQHVAGLIYAGSAIGAVFAGDLMSLFIYWELTAVSSVLLIWARRGEHSAAVGMRYVIVQLLSGMFLLAGGLLHWQATGSIEFGHIGLTGPAGALILLGFGIKSAFPLLHNWLMDAYPEATPTGTVFLSAFTTKLGIYALARGFAGTEELVWVGTLMAAFPIFYAVIENDLRRVLAYSMNNQLGFMVVGIGIGTELAINGAVAHAFADIIFKGLLFMSMGAVLLRTGTIKGSELGGLYKSMPWTTGFCMVGAASISAFPLFSGFVTKSMIMSAAAMEGMTFNWLVLLFASAGVFHHAGIKIPYFAFFSHDSGIRCEEAPRNMLVAMGIAAALCIGIGVFPGALYALLPYAPDYEPYTASHIVAQLQLLFFSALAFAVLMRTGIYPPELRSVNLDSDWFYRIAGAEVVKSFRCALQETRAGLAEAFAARAITASAYIVRHRRPDGLLLRSWPTGSMALWVMVMLLAYLLFYYLG
ncbi:MAG: Na(+)/H(+) antiporter subunit D [Gammaproteobacteria bacterium]|nr:Na(+)/H(+) antiporter subunit D [Gammaproteobacteria bacterium]MBU1644791.1 Na(+)/H(+) antiporter subunit D [Gammaproteobacteria bacterium]MBU1973024.1 Na(+)/H(+) antiporter subunit D [Gammaproteobacteria bacterium]